MIEEFSKLGIINGYSDGSFDPNEPMKRKHVAIMLIRAIELELKNELTSFSDVPKNHP